MKTNALIVVFLALLATIVTYARFNNSIGIDFYQYWGVGKAQQWSLGALKSPAAEQRQYAEVLQAHAAVSADVRLRKATEVRRELELLQTPLCYSIFTVFPANYSLAFGIFQIIQIILFLAAIVLLSAVHYGNWPRLLALALLLIIVYRPLASDLDVGNLNCLQLFGCVSLLVVADRCLARRSASTGLAAGAFMVILVFLALFKPNLIPVILLLAAYLWADQGTAIFARAAAAGIAFGAILMALPCLQFDSWTVWQDWYSYFRTWDSASLLALISQQNLSPALLVSQVLGSSVLSAEILIAALLLLSTLMALLIAAAGEESLLKGLGRAAFRSLRDPHLTIAAGITATLLFSPLTWYHYYTLSLLPALWLLAPRHSWKWAALAGYTAIILTSKIVPGMLRLIFGWTGLVSYAIVVSGLLPLWAGVLAAIANHRKTIPEA